MPTYEQEVAYQMGRSWGAAWCRRNPFSRFLAEAQTSRVAPLSASPQTENDRSRDTDQIPTHETPEKQA